MRATAMFKLFSRGSDKMERAEASQFLSCLLTTYLLLGSHDFRSGGGATAPVPDCDPKKKKKQGREQAQEEEEEEEKQQQQQLEEALPSPAAGGTSGHPNLPQAGGGGAAAACNKAELEKTEREKEREEFTLLGKAGDMDEYTVAQQFRDQQEAAKARAAASTIRVDAMESVDVDSTIASEVTHFVEGFNKNWADEPQLSLATFQEWVSTSSISLPNVMRSVLYQMCLIPAEAEVAYPRHLIMRPKVFAESNLLRPADILALSLASAGMQDDWSLAYSSARDGLSFNRLTNGIMGYDGPTLFVIRNEAGEIFGAFASTPWKESNQFQGDGACFLFTLRPKFHMFRPTTMSFAERNYMYLNTRGYQVAHGLGFGGKIGEHRLWLSAGFDECSVQAFGHSYSHGRLCNPRPDTSAELALDEIEVWGLGGKAAMASRDRYRKDTDRMTGDMRKLKDSTKRALVQDAFNQEMFLSKNFKHRATAEGGSIQ